MQRNEITEVPSQTTIVAEVNGTLFKTGDGWWTGFNPEAGPVEPGMRVELWTKGLGFTIRGLTIGGVVHRYLTVEEEIVERERQAHLADLARKDKFLSEIEEHDRRYDSLPNVLKKRIDRLRASSPDWRWRFEPHEMVCCVDAVNISNYCLEKKISVSEFRNLPYERQREAGIDPGHSGNTFGVACFLAMLLPNEEAVVNAHGAMAGLVGCQEYGCHTQATDQ